VGREAEAAQPIPLPFALKSEKPLYRSPVRDQSIPCSSGVSFVERYANLSGHSGVVAYKIAADSITVKFVDGNKYLYTYDSAGADNVDRMKQLALRGEGLSGFISATVRDRYAKKFR
jgi:hypothetical protein